MKFNTKFLHTALTALTITLFSAFSPQERSVESVSKLLIGNSWKLVNIIANPGQPILQSEEDLNLQRLILLANIEASDPLYFTFENAKNVSINYPKSTSGKLSGKTVRYKWQVLENGDVLQLVGPKKSIEKYKILDISENDLELLAVTRFSGNILLQLNR